MKCFVAMPISTPLSGQGPYEDPNHFTNVYQYLLVPAIREVGYEPISPLHKGSELIHKEIIKNINEADLMLCDMSSLNANVFFEFGIRTALDKPVCLVVDDKTPQIPFDTGIINRHIYEAVLRIWNIDVEKSKLVQHLKDTLATASGRNALWATFGIQTSGTLKPATSYSESDKLDYIVQMLNGLIRENAPRRQKRTFDMALDGPMVQNWATSHKAKNPFDMGTRNWQRCLFDLGLEGGVYHELLYDEATGNLQYQ